MNKGKGLFIVVSIILIMASVKTYLLEKRQRLTSRLPGTADSKAHIYGYEMLRYRESKVFSSMSGKRAALRVDGVLIAENGMRISRLKGKKREELESKTAVFKFKEDSIFSKTNSLDTAELDGSVELIRSSSRFQTEWLRYTDQTGEFFTDRPVRLEMEGQFIASEGGMTYNTKNENLRLKGGVLGSVKSNFVEDSMSGGKPHE